MVKIQRFDICLVNPDPTVGSDMKKTRPVVIISPNSMNVSRLKTIIVAPMTSTLREDFPTRVTLDFNDKKGQIALDQIRAIDRTRIIKVLGHLDEDVENRVLNLLNIIFQR